jgi:hypothetical protein
MNPLRPLIETVIADREQIVALGLILYTDKHPHIKRVLRDEDYWKALDEISGRKWTVLAARAVAGQYIMPAPRPGTLSMMRMIWREPAENKTLLQSFGLDSTDSLPLFVLFTPLSDGKLLQTKVRLEESSEQAAYDRLKNVVSSFTDAVDKIDMQYRSNYEAVFNALDLAASDIKVLDFLKSTLSFYLWVKEKLP